MEKFKVFYSWQSDTDKKLNNFYIRDCIKKSIKSIKKEIEFDIILDRDTKNESGSPHIVDTIFRKISTSDIFVCDLTIINSNWVGKLLKHKKTPNPNVLIELGYAVKVLGWERIICVVNTSFCKVEDLPFDIKQNRVSTYKLDSKGLRSKPNHLEKLFETAIKSIINDYDEILERFKSEDTIQHDIKIFQIFKEIFDERKLEESLEFTASNLITDQHYYNFWDRITDFHKNTDNHFIDEKLNNSIKEFSDSLVKYASLCAEYLAPAINSNSESLSDYEDSGIEITEEIIGRVERSNRYTFIKEPLDGNWNEYHKYQREVQTAFVNQSFEVSGKYKSFRKLIKEKLLI